MRGFAAAGGSTALRARRWDAIVLGGALPGLIAATRLGMRGLRVLVVEEAEAAERPEIELEPFSLAGAGGVLDAGLRALAVPLIDRHRLEHERIAYQVVLPGARVDVGEASTTAEELVTWDLADADTAASLVRGLEHAAQAEAAALLEAPFVRAAGLRSLGRGGARRARHARGLPAEAASPSARLAPFLDAQVRALSNLGGPRCAQPSPEARARLLGACLEGGLRGAGAGHSLRAIVSRRVRAVHVEFRRIQRGFSFVTVGGLPGIALDVTGEIWVGRALVVNAPAGAVAQALRADGTEVPPILDAPPPPHRRVVAHLCLPARALPEGMAPRLILAGGGDANGAAPATLSLHPERGGEVRLIGARVAPAAEADARGAAIRDALVTEIATLMPFAGGARVREPAAKPRWDDETAVVDPEPGEGWPGEVEIRAVPRDPVYRLARAGVAGLGFEGDLLLGWRAGDAIGADLA